MDQYVDCRMKFSRRRGAGVRGPEVADADPVRRATTHALSPRRLVLNEEKDIYFSYRSPLDF